MRESDKLLAKGCDKKCLATKFCEIISSEASITLQCMEQKTLYFSNHPSTVELVINKNN